MRLTVYCGQAHFACGIGLRLKKKYGSPMLPAIHDHQSQLSTQNLRLVTVCSGRGRPASLFDCNLQPQIPRISEIGDFKVKYDMKQAGLRIQRLRNQRGYTQEEFAKVLNIDRSNLSRIESGKRSCSVDLFVQLSDLFNVSLDYLILGYNKPDLAGYGNRKQLKEDLGQLIEQLETVRAIL